MNPRTPSVDTILAEAVEIADPAERRAFVEKCCAGDAALMRRVERLVDDHFRAGSFLEYPAADLLATGEFAPASGSAAADSPVPLEGRVIGPYRLLEQIGEGGMGLVFVAEQQHPVRRRVALKVVKPGMDSRQVVARFEAERQALAMMDHANIAKIYDGGATPEGRPYFVMELVKGTPITDYCDSHHLSTRQRLELFLDVCHAVQHAHTKGVIHRDLKPSNVLVEIHDVRPVVKVIDFGIAKATGQHLTDKTVYTAVAQMVGTPTYMSPEQAGLSSLDVDTRSDVYSLGVLLYELLTGTTPFDGETLRKGGYDEMRRIIREEEPPRPSTRLNTMRQAMLSTIAEKRGVEPSRMSQQLRGELDWIVMKALEKDRNRRYESASALALDVQRYLNDEAVAACPPSAAYRLRKYARRNRTLLTTVLLVGLAMVAGTAASIWQAVRATDAEGVADDHRKAAEASAKEAQRRTTEALASKAETERQRNAALQNLYDADARLGLVDWNTGNIGRLSSNLLRQVPVAGRDDLRGWEWYYLLTLCHQEKQTLLANQGRIRSISWSPDGRFLALMDEGGVNIYDTMTWRLARTRHSAGWACVGCWSPDGRQYAWGNTAALVCVWHLESDELRVLSGHTSSVWSLSWSPDGRYLASGGLDLQVRIWEPATGKCIRVLEQMKGYTVSLAFNPMGHMLASFNSLEGIVVWDTETWEVLHADFENKSVFTPSMCIAWRPDGQQLAGAQRGKCVLYNVADWSLASQWQAHTDSINWMAWNSDGTRLASAGTDRFVQIWDATTTSPLLTLRGHLDQVNSLAWDPSDQRLASSGLDGMVKIWSLTSTPQPRRLKAHAGLIEAINWEDDAIQLRSVSFSDGINLWNVVDGQCLAKVRVAGVAGARFSSDGKLLAVVDLPRPDRREERVILVYDSRSGELKQTVKSASVKAARFAFSPDGAYLAVSEWGPTIEVVDWRRDEVVFRAQASGFTAQSWSPDGRLLAAAGHAEPSDESPWNGRVYVFDVANHSRIMKTQHLDDAFATTSVAWSPNGKFLVSGDSNGRVEVWEVATSNRITALLLHTAAVEALAWSPDGRRVASASTDATVRVWNPFRGEELLKLDVPNAAVRHVAWSGNGQRLAAATAEGDISIWDASAGYDYAHGETFYFEQIHEQLSDATWHWYAGRKEEALAKYAQILEENKPRLGSFPPWVGKDIPRPASNTAAPTPSEQEIALAQMRVALSPMSADTANVLAILGSNLLKQEKYVQAEPLLREWLTIREQQMPDDWRRYNTMSMLGGALLGQKKYAEAEPLLLESYEALKRRESQIPPAAKVRLAEAAERLVRFYEATNQPDKAGDWRGELKAISTAVKQP